MEDGSKSDPHSPIAVFIANIEKKIDNARDNHKKVSKIVDKNGEPLVVYHGGTFGRKNEGHKTDPYVWESGDGNGWFSPDKVYSQNYTP